MKCKCPDEKYIYELTDCCECMSCAIDRRRKIDFCMKCILPKCTEIPKIIYDKSYRMKKIQVAEQKTFVKIMKEIQEEQKALEKAKKRKKKSKKALEKAKKERQEDRLWQKKHRKNKK